jgi:1-acyl-sn-glycerol-3-phosphate acyltransferase
MNNSFYNFTTVALLVLKHGGKTMYEFEKGLSCEEIYKNVYNFAKEALEYFDINVKVHGLENLIKGPAIICPSHTSMIDMPAIVYGLPGRKYFGTKKELFKIPLFGIGLEAIGMPKIDRSNREQAIKSLNEAAEMIKRESSGRKKENTAYLVIYPEGTREEDQDYKLLPFKKGAFNLSINSGIPIIPVSSFGGVELLPKNSSKLLKEKNRDYYFLVHQPILPKSFLYEGTSEEKKKRAVEDILEVTRFKIEEGVNFLKRVSEIES